MATLNIGMKVNRAITGATTVNANAYAMVTYNATAIGTGGANVNAILSVAPAVTRYFGPGQSIPSTFTSPAYTSTNGAGAYTVSNITYTLQSGVEIINTQ